MEKIFMSVVGENGMSIEIIETEIKSDMRYSVRINKKPYSVYLNLEQAIEELKVQIDALTTKINVGDFSIEDTTERAIARGFFEIRKSLHVIMMAQKQINRTEEKLRVLCGANHDNY